MNLVDLAVLAVVLFFAYDGLRRGFLLQTFNIAGFLFALLAALALYSPVSELLTGLVNLPKIAANPIGFLLVWILAEAAFFGLFSNLYAKFIRKFHPHKINKYLGIIPAVLNALLFLAFVLLFAVSLPINPTIKQKIFSSKTAAPLIDQAIVLEKPFNSIFGPITKQTLTFLTIKPEDKGTVDLKFTQTQQSVDLEAEQQMLSLVNEEREKAGSPPLVWDEDLAQVGRAHSRDMFSRGYFSHFSPEGKDVGDRLEESNIDYTYAGENLALAPTTSRAHTGLMNSEGHRRNILDPAFGKIGIGAIDGGVYGKMFTQVFTE